MIERVIGQIKNAERLLLVVEDDLAIAILDRDVDKAHILAAAKIGLLNEINDLKIDLFKRQLSEVR